MKKLLPVAAVLALLPSLSGCFEEPYVEIVSFDVTPRTLPPGGGEVELSWVTKNSIGIAIQPGNHYQLPERGTLKQRITETTDFTIGLSGQIRSSSDPRNVQTVRVLVETLQVNGTVVDSQGVPAPGREVSINGGEAVVTDAEGRFTIRGVTPPYHLRVRDPAEPIATVTEDQLFLDLTDPHPTVLAPTVYPAFVPRQEFELSVQWTGGGGFEVPADAEAATYLFVFAKEDSEQVVAPGMSASGRLSGSLRSGDVTGPIEVFVLQGYMRDVFEAPYVRTIFHYARMGHVRVEGPVETWPIDAGMIGLQPVAPMAIDLEFEAGAWLVGTIGSFEVSLPGTAPLRLYGDGSTARSYAFSVPPLPGATFSWSGSAYAADVPGSPTPRIRVGHTPWSGTGPLRLSLEAPPVALTPTRHDPFDGRLAFTREGPGPCRILLLASGGPVHVHTERRVISTELLASAGIELDPRGYWDAECPSGFANMEEALGDLARYGAALRAEPGHRLGHFGVVHY